MNAYPFGSLLENATDLEDWVAAFCARRAVRPRVGPPFPALGSDQTQADWLVEQFDRLGDTAGARDRLRNAVVTLISADGGRESSPELRDQIVGVLLHVAGKLDFVEVSTKLADWVRSPWLRKKHVYRLGHEPMSLRTKIWSLLIGWGRVDGVLPQLTEGLVQLALSGEAGTAQMCFVELGTRSPAEALHLIPQTVPMWHIAYWKSAVHNFFASVGPRALLNDEYRSAWEACLGPCFYDDHVYDHLRVSRPFSESDTQRPIWLFDVLERAGIDVTIVGTMAYLRMLTEPRSLWVDLSEYVDQSKWRRAADVPAESFTVAELAKSQEQVAA